MSTHDIPDDVEAAFREIVREELEAADAGVLERAGFTRRDVLRGAALVGGAAASASLWQLGAVGQASAQSGSGTIGTENHPLEAVYADEWHIDQVGSSSDPVQAVYTQDWHADQVGTSSDPVSAVHTESLDNVERAGAGRSIQDAVDAVPSSGGSVQITAAYDPANESLPVSVNKPCNIIGPGGTHDDGSLDFSSVTATNVLEIDPSSNASDPEDSVFVAGLRILGGQDAINIANTSFAQFVDIVGQGQSRHTVNITNSSQSNHSNSFYRVRSHDAGGRGITAQSGSQANACEFVSCACKRASNEGMRLIDGSGSVVVAGQYEKCGSGGIRVDTGSTTIFAPYVEDNHDSDLFDINISGESCSVLFARFNGLGNNDRAINVNGGPGGVAAGNRFTGYSSGFVHMTSNATDFDVRSTNHALDGSSLVSLNDGLRTRWDDVVGGGPLGGVDLSSVTGQFGGDRAIADGTSSAASAGDLARWDSANSQWQVWNSDATV